MGRRKKPEIGLDKAGLTVALGRTEINAKVARSGLHIAVKRQAADLEQARKAAERIFAALFHNPNPQIEAADLDFLGPFLKQQQKN